MGRRALVGFVSVMLASTAPGASAVLVRFASSSVVPPSSPIFATGVGMQCGLIVASALDLWIVDLAA